MKNFEKKSFLKFKLKFLFLNFEKNGRRKWKFFKKIDFEIWIEI
jgi:hypothetical protein